MRLFYSETSPYARKVRLVVREKGLAGRVQETACNPHEADAALRAANPLGRVPTLVLDDGECVYDSPVICDYLDALAPAPRLIPAEGPGRWAVLRTQALADGILDAAVAIVMEGRRPDGERSADAVARWNDEIRRALAAVESGIAALEGEIRLSQIAVATALGYLDFRLGSLDWRGRCPTAAHWYAQFEQRPAMLATRPG